MKGPHLSPQFAVFMDAPGLKEPQFFVARDFRVASLMRTRNPDEAHALVKVLNALYREGYEAAQADMRQMLGLPVE